MDLLRFSTAGSVDDGKSTLIGRLLFDSKGIFEDQLEAVARATKDKGGEVDLALLTDGLKAEREQGITIDVAYRYFATPKRKFIVADTPGHEQYTRNMATGASTADATIILVDARNGVIQQSRRHSYIAHLLAIPHLIVAVNKMDLKDYDQRVFESIEKDFREFAAQLGITKDITIIPISALKGDNVVNRSEAMSWYTGPTLIDYLETVDTSDDENLDDFRYPVQMVLRPNLDFRAFAGQIASGVVRKGDAIKALPSGKTSRVKNIHTMDGDLDEAYAPMSVALQLEDEIDISRGDMIVPVDNEPMVSNQVEATLVWMHETPMETGRPYLIKHTTHTVRAHIDEILYRTDINSLEQLSVSQLGLNDIGRVRIGTAQPLFFDPYTVNRQTGSFIIIDPKTNATVAAGMISNEQTQLSDAGLWTSGQVDRAAREAMHHHKAAVVLLNGENREEVAQTLEENLFRKGVHAYRLDGDKLSLGLNTDLEGSTEALTKEALRRTTELLKILLDTGALVISTLELGNESDYVRGLLAGEDLLEVNADEERAVEQALTLLAEQGVYADPSLRS